MFDVIIRGGEVVDGSGAARRRADVGITDGRIAAIGDLPGEATTVIDATGKVVAPGFIDVHTHFDAQVFWDGALTPSPLHGVTTALAGNCGFTIAPLSSNPADGDYLMRMLARVEGMPLESLRVGVPWNWQTTAEYLDAVDTRLGINAGFMVGHSAIRRIVMGEESNRREASDDEVKAMSRLLHDGLDAGGIGFSSSWARTHNDADGHMVPSRYASREELLALAQATGEHEGTSLEIIPMVGPAFEPWAVELMADLSATARRPLNWNILAVTAATLDQAHAKLQAGDVARARGGKVVALTIPMVFPIRVSFNSGFVLDAMPGWEEAMLLPRDQKLALFRDKAARDKLNEQAQRPDNPLPMMANWGTKVIYDVVAPENQQYKGRLVGEIATEQGRDPWDVLRHRAGRRAADQLRHHTTPRSGRELEGAPRGVARPPRPHRGVRRGCPPRHARHVQLLDDPAGGGGARAQAAAARGSGPAHHRRTGQAVRAGRSRPHPGGLARRRGRVRSRSHRHRRRRHEVRPAWWCRPPLCRRARRRRRARGRYGHRARRQAHRRPSRTRPALGHRHPHRGTGLSLVLREDRGPVAILTMNDPDTYNSLTSPLVTELKAALAQVRDEREVRVVILAGAGKGFSSGANLGGSEADLPAIARDRGPVGLVQMMQEHLAELILAIRELRQPVIGAVHGGAVGGGLAVALACDMRIASEDAFFASHFIRVGLSSCDVGTSYTLPRLVGPAIAAELMLTGRRFLADEALQLRVVNRVVPKDELLARAEELARQIAANSEYGVYMTKLGLWANLDASSFRQAMELENRTQVLGTFTRNMTEAGAAFREKREPSWKPL